MLRATGVFRANQDLVDRVLDSNDQERERGITILAKAASVRWNDVRLNLVDTPGHADFGGEVERALAMVDGVLLLVDAAEGPLPQTRYVLSKAIAAAPADGARAEQGRPSRRPPRRGARRGRRAVPRPSSSGRIARLSRRSRPIAREGRAVTGVGMPSDDADLTPLFQAIVDTIPAPSGDPDGPLQAIVTNLDASDYLGRLAIGRVVEGRCDAARTSRSCDEETSEGAPQLVRRLTQLLGLRRDQSDRGRRAARWRPVRHRRVPGGRDRRHARRSVRPEAAAPPRRGRAGAAHDLRRQHVTVGRDARAAISRRVISVSDSTARCSATSRSGSRRRTRPTCSPSPAAASCNSRC